MARAAAKDTIQSVWAREVLNFRGNPTVEAEVRLQDGSVGRAGVPTGISAGSNEPNQLFDGDKRRFGGKGVLKAVENVRSVIAPALKGMRASAQQEIDSRLVELDGTPARGRLGVNAILAVSLANAYAAAASQKLPLFRLLGGHGPFRLPVPCFDLLQGGAHAAESVDFQEYLVVPAGLDTFEEAVIAGNAVYRALRELLQSRGHLIREPYSALAAPLRSNREGMDILARAVEKVGYRLGDQVYLGMDAATSELYKDGKYLLQREGRTLSAPEMAELWEDWVKSYPLITIEDGMSEEDWDGWKLLTDRLGGRVQLVGDDFFTTNPSRVKRGIAAGCANAVLVKPNQVGTLSETLETMRAAHAAGWGAMLSTRSGETEDTTIADLSVLPEAGQIKTGPAAGPGVVKYNRLLRIQEELGKDAEYAGRKAFRLLG